MKVGIIGTGAIANKHAEAYRNIGFELVACWNRTEARGREFAQRWGAEYISDYRKLCCYPGLGFVDVCTFPDWHLEAVEACAEAKRAVQVQKPIATNLEAARRMIDLTQEAGVTFGVASQHRFDDATIFLKRALAAGRLGKLLEADAYVKWWRSEEYYSRPVKGSWQTEGGGALMNQAIHQVDLLRYLAGPIAAISADWQLGARHKIESEDVVNAILRYRSSATGVIQAATAFWPGYSERVELHGTKGAAIITGDRLTHWDVLDDREANAADPAPIAQNIVASGASEPMAIAVTSFERQFIDFAQAIQSGRAPLVDGEEGYRALEAVLAVYQSCREHRWVELDDPGR